MQTRRRCRGAARCTRVRLAGVWWSVASLAVAPAAAAGQASDADEIRRLRASSNAAIARHDTAGIGATFAEDVVVVTSRSDRSIGRTANLASFARQFAARPDVTYRRTPREVRVFTPWGMASEEGEWSGGWSEPDGKVAIGGRYFAKWRKRGGRWFIESETFVPERCAGSSYCVGVP